MAEVKMYTTPWCGYCRAAKRLFNEKGVDYEDIDVDGDHEKRAWLVDATGQRTVPQIFINGESIGGFTDALALERSGELDTLLAES